MTEALDTTILSIPMPNLPGAACKGQDTELWYSADVYAQQRAKDVCRTCPVRDACLQWAIDAGENNGIWGGLTPLQRKRLRWRR